jgi:hypothetical protein
MVLETLASVLAKNALITAFAFVGILVWVSYFLSNKLTRGHIHGSAIAIAIGLVLAFVGGKYTGGSKGLADVAMLSGVGIMGGAMFRDFAIVATAFGAHIDELKKAGTVGAATYIVGPVTGTALGATSDVIALSVAAGLTKSVLVMVGTPLVAKRIGLDNPYSAMIYCGLMGTTSGVAAGLAATDPKLVPYGAMTATFYTGVG